MTKDEIWDALSCALQPHELHRAQLSAQSPRLRLREVFEGCPFGLYSISRTGGGVAGMLALQWEEAGWLAWALEELGLGPDDDLAAHCGLLYPGATAEAAEARTQHHDAQMTMIREATVALVGDFNVAQLGLD